MRNLNKLSLLILVFACPVFVWAQTKRSPEFKEKYTLKEVVVLSRHNICIFRSIPVHIPVAYKA